jgi:hypothetical protein
MVNKIKTRGVKRTKYSKRKRFSKYRKHYTRKFGKRIQRRIKRRRQTRNKRGGNFDLSLENIPDLKQKVVEEVLYKGFANVRKISNFFTFPFSLQRKIIICKLNGPKWVIVKCRGSENCIDYDLKGKWSRPYKIYDMYDLEEIHDKNEETTYKFKYSTDNIGEHVYTIHLTKGVDGFSIEQGIENLRKAIREQKDKKVFDMSSFGYKTN